MSERFIPRTAGDKRRTKTDAQALTRVRAGLEALATCADLMAFEELPDYTPPPDHPLHLAGKRGDIRTVYPRRIKR